MNNLMDILAKIPSIAYWIPTIIFGVFVLYGVLRGFTRGFRKSLILVIMSLVTLTISILLFLFVFRKDFFTDYIVNAVNLKKRLNVDSENNLNAIVAAFIEKKLGDKYGTAFSNFENYVPVLTSFVLGIVYFIVTFIIWQFLYFISYLFIYLPIFRESKYRMKKIAKYDSEEHTETLSKRKYKNRGYKKHRGFGSLLGLFKGLLWATLVLSIFGALYYVTTGRNDENYNKEQQSAIYVTYGDETYELTELYKALYSYDTTGITYVLDRTCYNDTPIYAGILNFFTTTSVEVEDGNSVKIYPYEEIAGAMDMMHSMVNVISKYKINVKSSTLFDDLDKLFDANDDFTNDLLKITDKISASELADSLAKTLSLNFASILDTLGYSNKYTDVIFKGDNAITLLDLVTKDDFKCIINIAKNAMGLLADYKDDKDIKSVVINNSEGVVAVVEELQNLSVFSSSKSDKLNNIINELLTQAFSSVSLLKNVKFVDVDFISSGDTKGEINKLLDIFSEVLDTKMIIYENKTLKLNFGKLSSVLTSTTKFSDSKAFRCIMSGVVDSDTGSKYLYIPSNCYDSDGIITKEELTNFFTSLKDLVTNLNYTDENVYALSEIKSEILDLTIDKIKDDGSVVDPIYDSTILKSAVAKTLYTYMADKGYSEYMAASLILDDENIETNITNWTDEGKEVDVVLKAAVELLTEEVISYDTSTKEIDISLTNIYNLTSNDSSNFMYMAKNSLFLRSILINLLENKVNSSTIVIYVPSGAYTLDGDTKILTETETTKLMKTLGVICKSIDVMAGETDDIVNGFMDLIASDDKNALKGSYIMEATLSRVIYKSLSSTSYASNIPSHLTLDDDTIDTNIENWYGEGKEYENILNSLSVVIEKEVLKVKSENGSTSIDYNINNISKLFDENDESIDKMLKSDVLSSVMSGVIKDIDMGYTMYIPDSVMTDGVINKTDMKDALRVVTVFTSNGIDFNNKENISDDIKNSLSNICKSQDNKDIILKSTIMSGTISNAIYSIVTTNDLGIEIIVSEDLRLPEDDMTNMSNWIGEDKELSHILDSMAIFDLANITGISFAFDLSQEDINVIYTSKILSRSISNKIETTSFSAFELVIRAENFDENNNIKSAEIYNILNSVKVVTDYNDLTEEEKSNFDFNSVEISVNDIMNNETKIDAIFESSVLKDSMSYKTYSTLKEQSEGQDSSIYIPAKLVISKESDTNYENWVSDNNSELRSIINALKTLSGGSVDVENIDTNNMLNLTNDEINTVLKSSAIYYSTSQNIINSGITVPNVSKTTIDSASEVYVTTTEISNTMASLKVLGIKQVNEITIDTSMALSVSAADRDVMLTSNIVRYEVSNQVNNNVGSGDVPASVWETLSEQEFITKAELSSLMGSLSILGITDLKSYKESIKTDSLLALDSTKINSLLESYIIWYKFSANIKGIDSLIVTSASLDTNDTTYVLKNEITGLVTAANAMGMSSLSTITYNAKALYEGGSAPTLAASRIIRDTVTNKILVESSKSIINDTLTPSLIKTTYNSKDFYSYTADEMTYIINGLGMLGIEDLNVNFTLDKFKTLDSSVKNDVLSSYTLWLYISDTILKSAIGSTIADSNKANHNVVSYSEGYNNTDTSVVTKEYINSLS